MGIFTSPEERELVVALLAQLRYAADHMSKTSEVLATGVTNHVLDVKTHTFDSTGFVPLSYGATIGAVKVTNIGQNDVILAASSSAGAPPNGGWGVTVVPAGAFDVVNINNRFATLYGTSGQRVCYQVFTVGGVIGGGLVGVDGGAP